MKKNDFRKKQKGASLVEYGLLIALIAVVCISAVTMIGRNTRCVFTKVNYTYATGRPFLPSEFESSESDRDSQGCNIK